MRLISPTGKYVRIVKQTSHQNSRKNENLYCSPRPLWIVRARWWSARQGLQFFLICNPATSFAQRSPRSHELCHASRARKRCSFVPLRPSLIPNPPGVLASTRSRVPNPPDKLFERAPFKRRSRLLLISGVAASSASFPRTCVKAR